MTEEELTKQTESLEKKVEVLTKAVEELNKERYNIARTIDRRRDNALSSIDRAIEKKAAEICHKKYGQYAEDVRKMVQLTQQEEMDKITGADGVNVAVQRYLDLCEKNGRKAGEGELEAIIKGVFALRVAEKSDDTSSRAAGIIW